MLHERRGKNGIMGSLIAEISLFELGHDALPALHDITAMEEYKPLPQQLNMCGSCPYGPICRQVAFNQDCVALADWSPSVGRQARF